jgi:osmotically inducible lipoprotein OsmB
MTRITDITSAAVRRDPRAARALLAGALLAAGLGSAACTPHTGEGAALGAAAGAGLGALGGRGVLAGAATGAAVGGAGALIYDKLSRQ